MSVPLSFPTPDHAAVEPALPSADSVRLEVLQRVVPSMRHDLMNQLMVIELRTTLLKASLAQQGTTAAATTEAVGALCDDIREAIDVGRGLARWMHSLEPVGLDRVFDACVGWVGLAYKCRELELSVRGPEPDGAALWPSAAAVEGYFGVLAALWYWFDRSDSAGGRLSVQAEGVRGFRWRLEPREDRHLLDPALGWEMAQRVRIDDAGLATLLHTQGWVCELDGFELWMGCPASGL